MSYLQKIRAVNMKMFNASKRYLTQKDLDLNNLPKIEYIPPPIIQPSRLPANIKKPIEQTDESDDSYGMDFIKYIRDKKKRQQQQKPQKQTNSNNSNFQRQKHQGNEVRQSNFDFQKYQFKSQKIFKYEADQQQPVKQVKQKNSSIYSKKRQIQTLNPKLTPINYQDIKNKVKINDILIKRDPVRINYVRANILQWQNFNKKDDYRLKYVLNRFPKIKQFKNNQKAIIKCGLQNKNIFVCMPTGGGKSLTFQILTFLIKGVYLCVLPLVSLIFDQQNQAKLMGIEAYSLTASVDHAQVRQIYQKLNNFAESETSIVIFCTPQKLNLSQNFSQILQTIYNRGHLKRIIIDEVHCVSTWGKDFRVQYENLSSLKKRYPKTPILALTATVTEVVKQDIITRLGIEGCYYFQSSFNRPNLYYQVRNKDKNILLDIESIISRYKNKSGIIYCLSRRQCEQMCEKLNKKERRAAFYHADICEDEKKYIQEQWMNNKTNIIIATIAFGMGINKPDVRFVIHHTMSKSLQNYYQESGRAGRDGQFSQCILFYRKQDKQFLQSMNLKNQFSTLERKQFSTKQLAHMIKYCEDKFTCRRQFQLNYLGETDFDPQICNKTCDNCQRGAVSREYDCLSEGKTLIRTLIKLQAGNVSLSKNQLIDLIRGKGEKSLKYRMGLIERLDVDLPGLKQTFKDWKIEQIQTLIVEFASYELLLDKIVKNKITRNNRENQIVNVYLKCDIPKCKAFIDKVQVFPFRRNLPSNSRRNQQQSTINPSLEDQQISFNPSLEDQQTTYNPSLQNNQQQAYPFSNDHITPYQQTNMNSNQASDSECERLKAEKYQKYRQMLDQIFEQDYEQYQ